MKPDRTALARRFEARLLAFVAGDRLPWNLAVLAVLLSAPCLFIGFHLDDYIGRFINSDLRDGARLFEIYSGGYGLANGVPADTAWQMEQGFAPWWTDPELAIRLFRPLSLATHTLDARLFPSSAFAQHLHGVAWLGLLVLCATRLYRGVLGKVAGGMAAFLFAVDHTHGFIVGFISNRHALVTGVFGLLCLDLHHRATERELQRDAGGLLRAGAAAFYLATLLAGEFGVTIAGYLVAHAAFAERGAPGRRLLSCAPYLVITLVWRAVYAKLGYGAHGSGLYVDPLADPLAFVFTFAKRAPVLCLGQLFLPPAEVYVYYGSTTVWVVRGIGVLFMGAFAWALLPLLRRDPRTRFWAAGFVLSLVPATATFPSGRLLLFSSFGAIALAAQLWHFFVVELGGKPRPPGLRLSESVGALVVFVHAIIGPFATPLAVCGIAVSGPMSRAADALGPEIAGKDVLLLSAPDFFAPRMAPIRKRLEGGPLPRRWRGFSGGPERVTVRRTAAASLELEWEGGLLSHEYTELFRSHRAPMRVGDRVELEGLAIEIRATTPEGRALRAAFDFDEPLDSPRFLAFAWKDGTFAPFRLPELGKESILPKSEIEIPGM